MCGICGYSTTKGAADRDILQAMNDAIIHRGPNSEGYHIDGGVGLAMRRLSIIDVSHGDQPIFNEDKTIAIIFNGEIYNFPELRPKLEKLGHCFRTNSDTEAVIHAYETWGVECLQQLNGMFAFAIWDSVQERLFLARDRTGIKPLYYAPLGDTFLFASELKAMLPHPDFSPELDYAALDQYLTFEYVPAPLSIFKNVKKLPPGHAITLQKGEMKIWKYWDLKLEKSEQLSSPPTFDELAQNFRAVLKKAVQGEMLSDVPLGIFLSGGVDSSSIAVLMSEISPTPIQSFSIAFEDGSFDEAPFARLMAKHCGTDHHELYLTGKTALDLLPRLGQYLDEPLADSSFVPTMLLSGFAREKVTVALGGDGGDEVLAGYSTLQAHRLMELYKNVFPNPLRNMIQRRIQKLPASFNNISLDFKLKRFTSGHDLPMEVRHQTWLGSFDADEKRHVLLRQWQQSNTYEVLNQNLEGTSATHLLNRVLYLDMKMYLDGDILPKVDRASMSHSLEVRVPFLNYDVLSFLENVPIDFKLQRLTTKALLRRAMPDLPAEIVKRGKKGFNMPVAKWLTQELYDWTHDLLSVDRIKRQGIFNPQGVQKLLQDHMERKRDARKQLWTLLIFQMWYDQWYQF